jgi:hypothetical protein
MQTGNFYGLPTRIVGNEHLRLEFLAEAGPRLVRLSLANSGDNLLAEAPDFRLDTPYGEFHFHGGHRLWHAPEAMPRTYLPDDAGLEVESLPDGARLVQPAPALTGIRKQIDIHLHDDRPAVTIEHTLKNESVWPLTLAPWALTQMRLGGWAILPLPSQPMDSGGFLPNRNLSLWPYTRLGDPRLHLRDDAVLLQAQPALPPCKIGALNRAGWLGYLNEGVLFRKRFTPQPAEPHPDFGCNSELFCNDLFLELETIGPLRQLAPGQSAQHIEEWEVFTGLATPRSVDEVAEIARARKP